MQYSSRRSGASNAPAPEEARMTLKRTSLVAVTVLVGAIVTLLFRHALFASRPAMITVQAVAGGLLLWARLTFGVRSFHGGADPTPRGLARTGPHRWVPPPPSA